jgi:hypothetical protein
MALNFYVHGKKVGNMNSCLMMNQKPPALFEAVMVAGTNGYQYDLNGSITPNTFEGRFIEGIMESGFGNNWLIFQTAKPSGLSAIIIDGLELQLNDSGSFLYWFNTFSFVSGQSYIIEFKR